MDSNIVMPFEFNGRTRAGYPALIPERTVPRRVVADLTRGEVVVLWIYDEEIRCRAALRLAPGGVSVEPDWRTVEELVVDGGPEYI